jgi:glutamate synthase (NADPH) small chain
MLSPKAIHKTHKLQLEVVRTTLPSQGDGRIGQPQEVVGSNILVECDIIVPAIGTQVQEGLQQIFKDLHFNKNGTISVEATGKTNLPNVYAGGDAVLGAASVALAMQAGRDAARDFLANRS